MRQTLLEILPPYNNASVVIEPDQSVGDIIKEITEAHKFFAEDYDCIEEYFDNGNVETICRALFRFCKDNIKYEVEGDQQQTTKSPAAILTHGYGDCKHYAGFIAGVLSAIERATGRKINWRYRFASYNLLNREPGHVFVVVNDNGNELWVDPVLSYFNERLQPTYTIDKKINMALMRVSGVGELEMTTIPDIQVTPDFSYNLDEADRQLSVELLYAIELLLYYQVLDTEGNINDAWLLSLQQTMDPNEFIKLMDARTKLETASISGLFDTVFRGVKKVTLALPRGAYLSLVAINAFGMATKLQQAIKTTDGANKVRDMWYKFGGDWQALRNTIESGAKKPKILAGVPNIIGVAPAIPAWVATASAIIAALTPLINGILKSQQQSGDLTGGFDMSLFNDTSDIAASNAAGSGGLMGWLGKNIVWVGVGAAAIVGGYYFLNRPKRRR